MTDKQEKPIAMVLTPIVQQLTLASIGLTLGILHADWDKLMEVLDEREQLTVSGSVLMMLGAVNPPELVAKIHDVLLNQGPMTTEVDEAFSQGLDRVIVMLIQLGEELGNVDQMKVLAGAMLEAKARQQVQRKGKAQEN